MSKRIFWYVLVGHTPVPCEDVEVWGRYMEEADRQVALTEKNGLTVSTVFLSLDHAFKGEPVLFETMVFGGDNDIQGRYRTWDEAVEGHAKVCSEVFK